MVSSLITMLHTVQQNSSMVVTAYEFQTLNLHSLWQVATDLEMVTIEGFWQRIPGHYEAAVNQLGMIRMPRLAFLCEWKLLLRQFIQAVADAEAILTTSKARMQFEMLKSLEKDIPSLGHLYQY